MDLPSVNYDVLRVFVDEQGRAGNPLGVFLEPVPEPDRQRIATDLAYSETVFFEDPAGGVLRIHTPAHELPFAGHPVVGAAWLLARERARPATLRPPAGVVRVSFGGDLVWAEGRPEWCPEWGLVELADARAVDDAQPGGGAEYVWAWTDRGAGEICARCFAAAHGVPEDPATGSAAMRLAASLGRPITIRQGAGSVLHARTAPGGGAAVGGRVVHDHRRAL